MGERSGGSKTEQRNRQRETGLQATDPVRQDARHDSRP
jgi:hypothetical protein